MVGVNDRFGISGKPWELMQEFGLCAEHIAARVLQLRERGQSGQERASAA
jgi:transketolase C-terminal domain/subunit